MNILKIAKNVKRSKAVTNVMSYYSNNKIKVKLIALVVVCSSMIVKGIMQQPQIIANKEEIASLNEQIEYEDERQNEIAQMSDMVETDEYIEKIARDKLGMIKANEKIFIDVSKSDK